MHYTARGEGPGLLLIHATGTDGETNFGHLYEHFTDLRTVITSDFAGSGGTPLGETPLTVDVLADQVIGAATAATDGPVDVLGFSLGSVVAAAAAAARPDLVRRLVLVNGWSRNDDPRQRLLMDLWQRLPGLDEQAFREFTALSVFSPPYLTGLGAEGIKAGVDLISAELGALRQMELAATVDIRDRLARISAPTLVIGSSHDHWMPVEHARETARAIGGSRYLELACGHMSVFERVPEVVHAVREFITG